MRFFRKLRQRFCRHQWSEAMYLNGFTVENGWLERVQVRRCHKCGKQVRVWRYEP